MTKHIDTGPLQDYLEGFLAPALEEEVRSHLRSCSVCRREVEIMRRLVDDLAELPTEAEPPRDLFDQVVWRTRGSERPLGVGGDVEPDAVSPVDEGKPPGKKEGRDRASAGTGGRRRIALTAWQLLAAGIALILLSGGTVWTFLSIRSDQPGTMATQLETPAQLVDWQEAYGGYQAAVDDLERFLEEGREVLDPETVQVLEGSLDVIDQAIEEAAEALRRDPASPVLRRFLAANLRKKMELLRKAAMAVYANT